MTAGSAAAPRALAWGRLARLSLAPSAVADALAGVLLAAGGVWPGGGGPWLLVLASLGVYHGAMALNDWADREGDRRTRPDRPIPSGAVPAGQALVASVVLLALGVGAAALASPGAGLVAGAVAALAVLYDLAGRGPLAGPLLLGSCRAGNLSLGFALLGGEGARPAALAVPAVYGAYVVCVSCLARLEDDEDSRPLGRRPSRYLVAAAISLALLPLLGPFVAPGGPHPLLAVPLALCWWSATRLAQLDPSEAGWTRAAVGRAAGGGLRRLLVFTAATALLHAPVGAAPWLVAGAILAGYPASRALRSVFPPT